MTKLIDHTFVFKIRRSRIEKNGEILMRIAMFDEGSMVDGEIDIPKSDPNYQFWVWLISVKQPTSITGDDLTPMMKEFYAQI